MYSLDPVPTPYDALLEKEELELARSLIGKLSDDQQVIFNKVREYY
jgi:hypothetical protein